MYVGASLFMYVYAYMFVCTCGRLACIYNYLYVLVACYSILDLFGEIRTSSTGSERAAIPGPSGEREIPSLQPGLPQHPGYPPMQSNSKESHHNDRNGDSPGNEQIPQCECLSLSFSLSLFIKWSQILIYMWCKLLSRTLMLHDYVWRSPSMKVDGHLPFILHVGCIGMW